MVLCEHSRKRRQTAAQIGLKARRTVNFAAKRGQHGGKTFGEIGGGTAAEQSFCRIGRTAKGVRRKTVQRTEQYCGQRRLQQVHRNEGIICVLCADQFVDGFGRETAQKAVFAQRVLQVALDELDSGLILPRQKERVICRDVRLLRKQRRAVKLKKA